MTGLENCFEMNVQFDLGQIKFQINRSYWFIRIIIMIVKNGPKMKSVETLFTQIGLRIAQKHDL
jgi:hypothetical protein